MYGPASSSLSSLGSGEAVVLVVVGAVLGAALLLLARNWSSSHVCSISLTTPNLSATKANAPPVRVAAVTIKDTTFRTTSRVEDPAAVLWQVLSRCVVPAEQRAHVHFGSGGSDLTTPSALLQIDVNAFASPGALNHSPILGPLTSHYPALVRSILALKMSNIKCDESDALANFAALAKGLQELTFVGCGLTSVRGLEGRCEKLRRVNLSGCFHLSNLVGLESHINLEEVHAVWTPLASIEPLRSCSALMKVDVSGCQQLSSIDALADHWLLQVVDAAQTLIARSTAQLPCPDKGELPALPALLHRGPWRPPVSAGGQPSKYPHFIGRATAVVSCTKVGGSPWLSCPSRQPQFASHHRRHPLKELILFFLFLFSKQIGFYSRNDKFEPYVFIFALFYSLRPPPQICETCYCFRLKINVY